MAVIDKTKAAQTKGANDASDKSENKGETVDLLQAKNLPTGAKRKHDIEEDAWEYSAPPKAGRFSIKLHLAKDPTTVYKQDRQGNEIDPIYSIAIEGEIVNSPGGEYDKIRVFPRVSTAVGRGKSISTAAGLLVKLGYGPKYLANEIDDLSLATLVLKAIMKEPIADVEIDWQAYSKEDSRVVYRGMHKFPQDESGEPMHIIDYMTKAKVIEEIRASIEVVHWYGKGEKESVNKPGQTTTSKTNAANAAPVALAPDDEEPEVKETAKPEKARAAAVQQLSLPPETSSTDIEDELADLED